jgi:hypothetical protein
MVNLCSIPFETVQNSKSCKTIQSTQIQKLAKHIETHRKIRKKYCFCAKFGGQLWHQHIRRRDYVIQAHGRPLRDTWRSGRTPRHATRKEPSSFVVLVFIRLQQILCKALSNNLSLPLATSHNRHQLLWFLWECSECSKSEVHHTASPIFFLDHQICWTVWLCDSQQVNPLRRLLSSALVEHHMLKQCQDKRDKTCSRCCAKHIETHRNTVYIHTKPHCLVTQQSHTEQNGSVTGHRLWHSE